MTGRIAVELGGRDRDLVGPLHDAVPVDREDPRLREQAPLVRDVGRLELAVRVEDGLERAVDDLQLVGLDVDERHSGLAAAIGLKWSSVGPHCWLVQNFGVAKMSMNGLCAASASATEVW